MFRNKLLVRSRILYICAVIFLLTGCGSGALLNDGDGSGSAMSKDQAKQLNHLNEKAEQLYRSVLAEQIDEARMYMIELEKMVTNVQYDKSVTVEGINALTTTIVTGKKLLNSTKISQEELQIAVTTIRLATDALNQSRQPLWHQYESTLQTRLQSLLQAIESKNIAAIRSEFAVYQASYQIVHPAIQIALAPEYGEQMMSMIIYMDQLVHDHEANVAAIHEHYYRIEQMTTYLYHGEQESIAGVWNGTNQRMFFSLYVGLATIIAAVLAFVAWKKYRAQMDYVLVRRNRDLNDFRKF